MQIDNCRGPLDTCASFCHSELEGQRNRAKCKRCGDIIESKSVHDFQACKCKAIFVDGGNEYWRWGGDAEAFERLGAGVSQ